MDGSGLLERILALLDENRIRYCVIGGQAVNAYAEPLVSLDLDVAVAASDQERLARPIETHPQLRSRVPAAILDRLE